MEERFSWMKDADLQMLSMGLEPYPWEQFAEEISKTGENEFQAIEQRACTEDVLQTGEAVGPESLVGATLVIRSRTIVTAFNMISRTLNASQATARMLCRMAEAFQVRSQLDLIVSTDAVLAPLGACADILTKGWDIDQYCQCREWKELMLTWKNKQLRAVCRNVDEEGLDAENSPFLKLALDEVRQTVSDVLKGGATIPEEERELEGSDQ
jgi:hypothetical protein